MEHDIAKVLAYEVKKELADRYFGFRRLIEEDKETLDRRIRQQSLSVEQQICLDLVRIYILLRDEALIQEFCNLTGLKKAMFYDPYVVQSPTIRRRVFEGVRAGGLTMAARFRNLIFNSYEILVEHVTLYLERFGELLSERETIEEEIRLFYRQNDLGNIMTFLRGLDSSPAVGGNPLESGVGLSPTTALEEKLRVSPPEPIENSLPIIPPLVPLRRIRRPLKKLADAAYQRRKQEFQLRD
ncbi:MAG: hypothetical protein AB1413_10525 [Thermodesulfobacteriota bacterium]